MFLSNHLVNLQAAVKASVHIQVYLWILVKSAPYSNFHHDLLSEQDYYTAIQVQLEL